MRIAFVVPLYPPAQGGGMAAVVRELAEEFSQRGHACSVFCANAYSGHWLLPFLDRRFKNSCECIDGVQVHRLRVAWSPMAGAYLIYHLFDLVGLARIVPRIQLASYGPWFKGLGNALVHERCKIVHITPFPFHLCRQTAQACRKIGIPYSLAPAWHEGIEVHDNRFLFDVARGAALVVVSTRAGADGMIRHGVFPDRVLVHPVGVPINERSPQRDPAWGDRTVVLYAGTKHPGKGALAMLEAARRLQSLPDILFVAIGPATRKWREAVRRGLPQNFQDMGFLPEEEKQRLFASCDIFAMPSREESFGRVYAEAWQYEKPVIGCNIPAIRQIIDHEHNGLLVPFGDVPALATAIVRLADNCDLRKRLGRAGGLKARSQFSNKMYHDAMEAAFVKLLS